MGKSTKQHAEFPIQPRIVAGLLRFFHSQLLITPPCSKSSFSGKTVIITGANRGLGLEAARHFYRLDAEKVIITARDVSIGQVAKEDIVTSVTSRNNAGAIEIWQLDQASNQSTIDFAGRVQTELPRLDAVVLSAGINVKDFKIVDGYEQCIQVNVLNTFLLALSVLPKLRDTKKNFANATPHLTIVSSEAHRLTAFPEINNDDIYAAFNEEENYSQQPRYQATKLMEVLLMRQLVARLKTKPSFTAHPVIINAVNPGLCFSKGGLADSHQPWLNWIATKTFVRTAEVGARCLVLAASASEASHGEFQSDGDNQPVEDWIPTSLGQSVQNKVWDQTVPILEARVPGLLNAAGV